MDINVVFLMVFILLLSIGIAVIYELIFQYFYQKRDQQKRKKAHEVLAKHGLTNHLYLPCTEINDEELRTAMTFFADAGHLILDKNENIVGKIASSHPVAMKFFADKEHIILDENGNSAGKIVSPQSDSMETARFSGMGQCRDNELNAAEKR